MAYYDNVDDWKKEIGNTLDIPTGLSRKGRKAAYAIRNFMKKHHFLTGGCKTFYTPAEWDERGESYGGASELVFVYDGGDLYSIMSNEFGFDLSNELQQNLNDIGVFAECCTSWYSAIYE
tara:strand:+ start:12854 stop:13213 length:360 start_codon:yes stop_codon:yes gene_type:complete